VVRRGACRPRERRFRTRFRSPYFFAFVFFPFFFAFFVCACRHGSGARACFLRVNPRRGACWTWRGSGQGVRGDRQEREQHRQHERCSRRQAWHESRCRIYTYCRVIASQSTQATLCLRWSARLGVPVQVSVPPRRTIIRWPTPSSGPISYVVTRPSQGVTRDSHRVTGPSQRGYASITKRVSRHSRMQPTAGGAIGGLRPHPNH
jgi:hypothetical protein